MITDHKPLLGVFKGKISPSTVATRLQRYFHRLSIFDFEIEHKSGKENFVADCLSRLPIAEVPCKEDLLEIERSSLSTLNFLVEENRSKLNSEMISKASSEDRVISKLIGYVINGWPAECLEKELQEFFANRLEFDVEAGCLIFGERVVIPQSLKMSALHLLHANHRGIVQMKQLARKFIYWPGITVDIQNFAKSCKVCQVSTPSSAGKTYGEWPKASSPFERVHIDFFHKFGKTFLLLVDAYSRRSNGCQPQQRKSFVMN